MKIFFAAAIAVVMTMASSIPANAGVAFFKYSYISGMNRICVYDHLSSSYAMTIKSHEICPVTINI